METKPLTDDDFFERYTLVTNQFDSNASWGGAMFETYGEEVQHVCDVANNPITAKRVWTLVEGDNNTQWIVAGYHYVNREGYLITEEDWTDDGEGYLSWDSSDTYDGEEEEELGGEA